MDIRYCRRERAAQQTADATTTVDVPCGKRIERANALGWCEPCRVRLPLWPANEVEAVGA